MQKRTIAFIGAGNMSASIISGLVNNGYPAELIHVSNPSVEKLNVLKEKFAVQTSQDNNHVARQAEVIILAVKPQMMANMIAELDLTPSEIGQKLFISIAAGLPIERLAQMLKSPTSLIRTMPNTPSLLGLGMTGMYAPSNVSTEDKAFAEQIMTAVGKVVWVAEENGIDHIIALAGSAPAYFFLFMEGMVNEAINFGFSAEEARKIVEQVAIGSAEMVRQNSIDIADLRQQVTSKGGTTAAAIESFTQSDLAGITSKAMQAAIARAQEMAKLF